MGEFKKRMQEEARKPDEVWVGYDYEYYQGMQLVEEWIEEARKEFPLKDLTEVVIYKVVTPDEQRFEKIHKWYVKWFSE